MVGAIFLFGAVSLIITNQSQLLSVVAGCMRIDARFGLVAAIGLAATVEVGLGLRLLVGPDQRERAAVVVFLLVLVVLLIIRGTREGWLVTYGCFEAFVSQSVAGAIARNAGLIASVCGAAYLDREVNR